MTRDQILSSVKQAFDCYERPFQFVRGTCRCEECCEHETTMQGFTPGAIPLEELDNPGWDPICFASDEAFAYLLPSLAAVVLNHPNGYVDQFLFHLNNADRLARLNPSQAVAMVQVLDYLVLEHGPLLDQNRAADDLFVIRAQLQAIIKPSA